MCSAATVVRIVWARASPPLSERLIDVLVMLVA